MNPHQEILQRQAPIFNERLKSRGPVFDHPEAGACGKHVGNSLFGDKVEKASFFNAPPKPVTNANMNSSFP
jgi:hypothetical protein